MSNRVKPTGVHSLIDSQVVIDGHFVSQKVSQIVQAINEYEPGFEVQFIPREARDADTAAYRIRFHPENGEPYTVFHIQDEDEFDERVLARIIANDQQKKGVYLTDFEAYEKALMRTRHQAYLDSMEEAQDIAAHVAATHLNTYKVNDDLVIKEGIPWNAAHLDENNRPKKGSTLMEQVKEHNES